MKTRLVTRAKATLRRTPPADPHGVYAREREGRREFFYDAFKALRFNGIDGDYAEFGSWGGVTFALAYHESRRHGHRAHLWAFDSFQGFPGSEESRDVHPEWVEGKMAISLEQFRAKCAANGLPSDVYTTIAGFYDDTLARMPETAEPDERGTRVRRLRHVLEYANGALLPRVAPQARDDRCLRRLLLLVLDANLGRATRVRGVRRRG